MSNKATDKKNPAVVGVILAGGRARRMGGGDKGLQNLGTRTVLDFVIERTRPQVRHLILNAHGDPDRFARYKLPVAADVAPGHLGPLAGVLTAMAWAGEHAPECQWIASFPADTPFTPRDLVARLMLAVAVEQSDLACAASHNRPHPVVGLWPVALKADLKAALVGEGVRKIDAWTARFKTSVVPFPTKPVDPFFNINTEEDLKIAQNLLAMQVLADEGSSS